LVAKTPDLMFRSDIFKQRGFLPASLLDKFTAILESASGRIVE
jgi:hypothetical protein